jgi:hypothetical protein
MDFTQVQRALLVNHQLMLLSAGLSGAVEEAQLRVSSISNGSSDAAAHSTVRGMMDAQQQEEDLAQQQDQSRLQSSLDALQIVSDGIERAVRQDRRISLDEIDSLGLSVVDAFYSEVRGIVVHRFWCRKCIYIATMRYHILDLFV